MNIDGKSANLNRVHADVAQIQKLSESLLSVESSIAYGVTLLDPSFNKILKKLIAILCDLHPADIAMVLESLPLPERVLVWRIVCPEDVGEILLEVSEPVRDTLIEAMDENALLDAVDRLDADELAELAPDLPNQVIFNALSSRDEEERAQIASAMSFEENQVGALMDFELVSIRADVSCEVVLRYLRLFDQLPDHTDKIFVVDDHDVLQGILPIRKLLVVDPDTPVANMVAHDVVTFHPEDDVEEAAAAFERYDLVTAPVVDSNNKLIGRVTVDEMLDVIREESETDLLNMAGLQEEEDLEPIPKGIIV